MGFPFSVGRAGSVAALPAPFSVSAYSPAFIRSRAPLPALLAVHCPPSSLAFLLCSDREEEERFYRWKMWAN